MSKMPKNAKKCQKCQMSNMPKNIKLPKMPKKIKNIFGMKIQNNSFLKNESFERIFNQCWDQLFLGPN